MMGWGPVASTLKTCRYGRSTPGPKRPAKYELRLDKGLHEQSPVFIHNCYK